MAKVYLLLGGNLADRESALNTAKTLISQRIGSIIQESSIYETEAWGFESEINFLNQSIVIKTEFSPNEVLERTLIIEKEMGREKLPNYASRTIDIDILFYENWIIDSKNLVVPHPHLHKRQFTLQPLNEIMPTFIHPVFKRSIKHLTDKCDDMSKVKIYKKI